MQDINPLWLRRLLIIVLLPILHIFGVIFFGTTKMFEGCAWSFHLLNYQAKLFWNNKPKDDYDD